MKPLGFGAARERVAGASGWSEQPLVDAEHAAATLGGVLVQGLDAATALDPVAHPTQEKALYVLSGRLRVHDGAAAHELAAGDAAFVPAGCCHRLEAVGEERVVLLAAYAGGGELASSRGGELDADGAGVRVVSGVAGDGPGQVELDRQPGYTVHRLVTTDSVGSRSLILGVSTYEEGVTQGLHRHPNAEEFVVIVEGEMLHVMEEGAAPIGPANGEFTPQGEWHGVQTPPGVGCHMVYGYLGAGTRQAAGFELMEDAS